MNVSARLIASALLVTLLAAARTASAQTEPEEDQPALPPMAVRAEHGLFGGDRTLPGLSVLFSGGGGYDSNVLAGQEGGGGNTLQQGQYAGNFGDGGAALRYLYVNGRTVLNTLASSNIRYYPGLDTPASKSHSLAVDVQFGIGRRWEFDARQAVAYSSFNRISPIPRGPSIGLDGGVGSDVLVLPALPLAPSADLSVLSRNAFAYESELVATQMLSSRSRMRYSVMRHHSELGIERRPMVAQGAGATYQRQMTRYGGLRLGYSFQQADYHRPDVPDIVQMHYLDTGYDYFRPLSFSRRTTVGFSTGMQAFDRRDAMFYRGQFTGYLSHQLGRTWELGGSYDRGAQFVDVLQEPVYANTVVAHLGGLIGGQRLGLMMDASYSDGRLTYTLNQNQMLTYAGSSRLQYAMSEQWGLYAAYSYYYYEFGSNVPLPPGLLPQVGRHSARIGVTYWLPLITQRGERGTR
jgi:hypothetical protein